jgi:regulator of replication initiation timing
MGFFARVFVPIAIVAIALYAYIEEHNRLTKMRIEVPQLEKKLHLVEEENTRLQFEIEKFQNPLHLMELSRGPQYSHLKNPYQNDIITIRVGPKKPEGAAP